MPYHHEQREASLNWKRLATWLVAIIVILLVLVVVIRSFKPGPSPVQVMLDVMALRTTNDTVMRAQLIASLDEDVKRLDSDAVRAQWSVMTGCIAANACSQDDFFDFLLVVAVENRDDVPNADLIVNAVIVNRYWGDQNKIIEFSRALSDANEQVDAVHLRTVKSKWDEVVKCNGRCKEYHELFFDFVKLLLAA